ncbi:hypothetical protein JOQ06_028306 [Pogonophryne albipinna]|uniref:Uncharacterized protein n=1 Tax=Pogonophryne albipinna TaxID=1090488 RepID=A0AAD6B691_9TELE|nr:hypothetical protein JOQ06_028306 [Pogonophryne albipinna]
MKKTHSLLKNSTSLSFTTLLFTFEPASSFLPAHRCHSNGQLPVCGLLGNRARAEEQFNEGTPIRAQSTWDKGCVSEGSPTGHVDVECLFAPLQPAGHTKAQKGYIDSALQGVVAQQKGNGTLFQLPSSQCCTPNQRAPDPFVEMVGGQGKGGDSYAEQKQVTHPDITWFPQG